MLKPAELQYLHVTLHSLPIKINGSGCIPASTSWKTRVRPCFYDTYTKNNLNIVRCAGFLPSGGPAHPVTRAVWGCFQSSWEIHLFLLAPFFSLPPAIPGSLIATPPPCLHSRHTSSRRPGPLFKSSLVACCERHSSVFHWHPHTIADLLTHSVFLATYMFPHFHCPNNRPSNWGSCLRSNQLFN